MSVLRFGAENLLLTLDIKGIISGRISNVVDTRSSKLGNSSEFNNELRKTDEKQ